MRVIVVGALFLKSVHDACNAAPQNGQFEKPCADAQALELRGTIYRDAFGTCNRNRLARSPTPSSSCLRYVCVVWLAIAILSGGTSSDGMRHVSLYFACVCLRTRVVVGWVRDRPSGVIHLNVSHTPIWVGILLKSICLHPHHPPLRPRGYRACRPPTGQCSLCCLFSICWPPSHSTYLAVAAATPMALRRRLAATN